MSLYFLFEGGYALPFQTNSLEDFGLQQELLDHIMYARTYCNRLTFVQCIYFRAGLWTDLVSMLWVRHIPRCTEGVTDSPGTHSQGTIHGRFLDLLYNLHVSLKNACFTFPTVRALSETLLRIHLISHFSCKTNDCYIAAGLLYVSDHFYTSVLFLYNHV